MNMQDILKNNYTVSQFIEMIGDDIPLLKEFKNTPQDKVWHAEGDVHIHTDMVLNETYSLIANEASYLSDEDKFCLIMSALLHDISKPVTTSERERDGRICVVAPKHEYMGISYLVHKLQGLKFTQYQINTILGLVGYHQAPKLFVIRDMSKWQYYSLSQKCRMDLIYFLEIADMKGRTSNDLESQLEYLELFKLYAQEFGCFDKAFVPVISDSLYVQSKGFRALLDGKIVMPEEAEAKYFKHNKEHAELVVLCGISGVGKSSHIKHNYPEHKIISLDDIRGSQFKDRQNMSDEGKVLQIARLQIKTALAKKEKIVYDATNVRKDFRDKVLTIGENYDALTRIDFLTDSIPNIINRDKDREHSVGEKVIKYQEDRFEFPEITEADTYSMVYVEKNRRMK